MGHSMDWLTSVSSSSGERRTGTMDGENTGSSSSEPHSSSGRSSSGMMVPSGR